MGRGTLCSALSLARLRPGGSAQETNGDGRRAHGRNVMTSMTSLPSRLAAVVAVALGAAGPALPTTSTAAYDEDGKYFTDEGVPTFKVDEDGTVDWYTFSGYRRYHAECHVCHGPDGQGSTYAPAIAKSAVAWTTTTSSTSW